MYLTGDGVPEDPIRAYAWLHLAAAQGDEHAAAMRERLRESMTGGQIAQAQELAATLVRGDSLRKPPSP